MFPNSLFDWAEFFDAEFIATLTKADEILNCPVEALIAINYDQIKTLYHPFNQSLCQIHSSHGSLLLGDRIVMLPQLRAPVMMRLYKGHTAKCKEGVKSGKNSKSVIPERDVLKLNLLEETNQELQLAFQVRYRRYGY